MVRQVTSLDICVKAYRVALCNSLAWMSQLLRSDDCQRVHSFGFKCTTAAKVGILKRVYLSLRLTDLKIDCTLITRSQWFSGRGIQCAQ
jgi:hypothetical protein